MIQKGRWVQREKPKLLTSRVIKFFMKSFCDYYPDEFFGNELITEAWIKINVLNTCWQIVQQMTQLFRILDIIFVQNELNDMTSNVCVPQVAV